jgi:hypothetical protein
MRVATEAKPSDGPGEIPKENSEHALFLDLLRARGAGLDLDRL